jgi:alkylated DNA repair dioxygenase AlkB
MTDCLFWLAVRLRRTNAPSKRGDPWPADALARTRGGIRRGAGAELAAGADYRICAPGAAIGWHRDKSVFEDVIALSFLAPCTLRLRRGHEEGWDRRSIELLPRSAYLLRGPARRDWEHSIPPVGELRFSVTFRTLRAATF